MKDRKREDEKTGKREPPDSSSRLRVFSSSEPLLTRKELAAALKRHVSYVSAMKSKGFKMPGGTATLSEARAFLRRVKWPRAR